MVSTELQGLRRGDETAVAQANRGWRDLLPIVRSSVLLPSK
jgi:hypothetical protein